jgi:hypothetical protein
MQMMCRVSAPAVVSLLLLPAADAIQFTNDAPDAKQYPVTRVVELLKGMSKQLQEEQDTDEEVYEKMACWCETNDKAKTKAIADAEQKLSQLGATIEKHTALGASLNSEIEGLKKEIAHNEKALAEATAIRKKQLAEFNEDEKQMLLSIQGLGQAITVLGKHHGEPALIDQGHNKPAASDVAALFTQAAKVAEVQLIQHGALLQGTVTPHQRRVLSAIAAKQTQQPEYENQSGEIFGILKQMKATFEENLSGSQKEEKESQAAYDELKIAKDEEIKVGKGFLEEKEQQLAASDEALEQAKQEKEDTEASLTADQKFLMDLKERCSLTDKEWEERQKTRSEEMAAVAKAVEILTDDEARDTFSKTFNFLQTGSSVSQDQTKREKAVATLMKTGNPKLIMLATTVRLDAFVKVKKAIDDMVAELLQEAKDELAHKDTCIDNLAQNERDVAKNEHAKETTQAKIGVLEALIKDLTSTIKTLTSEVADLKTQLQRADEDRVAANKEYQGILADQQETQKLLKSAWDVLAKIYRPELLQVQVHQAPPEGFSDTAPQSAGNSVLMTIEQIIADAKELEAEATHDEEQAVKAHAEFTEETTASIEAKSESITDREGEKAQAEQDHTEAVGELRDTVAELESLSNGLAAVKGQCDFFLKNWDVRTAARAEEVQALRDAKAFLSGMTA